MRCNPFHFVILILSFCLGCREKCCDFESKVVAKNDSIIAGFDSYPRLNYYKEPNLNSLNYDCFRLIITPVLQDTDRIYTLEKRSDSIYFSYKYLTNKHPYSNRIIVLSKTIKLKSKQWKEFNDLVKEKCFWSIPCGPSSESGIMDGIGWFLEGYTIDKNNCTNRNFHFVVRAQGDGPKEFFEICEKLLGFAKMNE